MLIRANSLQKKKIIVKRDILRTFCGNILPEQKAVVAVSPLLLVFIHPFTLFSIVSYFFKLQLNIAAQLSLRTRTYFLKLVKRVLRKEEDYMFFLH